jgi:hypothetical protein
MEPSAMRRQLSWTTYGPIANRTPTHPTRNRLVNDDDVVVGGGVGVDSIAMMAGQKRCAVGDVAWRCVVAVAVVATVASGCCCLY